MKDNEYATVNSNNLSLAIVVNALLETGPTIILAIIPIVT